MRFKCSICSEYYLVFIYYVNDCILIVSYFVYPLLYLLAPDVHSMSHSGWCWGTHANFWPLDISGPCLCMAHVTWRRHVIVLPSSAWWDTCSPPCGFSLPPPGAQGPPVYCVEVHPCSPWGVPLAVHLPPLHVRQWCADAWHPLALLGVGGGCTRSPWDPIATSKPCDEWTSNLARPTLSVIVDAMERAHAPSDLTVHARTSYSTLKVACLPYADAAIQVDYRVGNPHFLGMLEGRYLIIEIASLILIMDINTWLTHCIRVALPYWLSMHPAVESSKLTHMVAMNIPLRFCNHM